MRYLITESWGWYADNVPPPIRRWIRREWGSTQISRHGEEDVLPAAGARRHRPARPQWNPCGSVGVAVVGWFGYVEWTSQWHWAQAKERLAKSIETRDFAAFDREVVTLGPEDGFPPDVRTVVEGGRARQRQLAADDVRRETQLSGLLHAVLAHDIEGVGRLGEVLLDEKLTDSQLARKKGLLELHKEVCRVLGRERAPLQDGSGAGLCKTIQSELEGPSLLRPSNAWPSHRPAACAPEPTRTPVTDPAARVASTSKPAS